MVKASQPTHLNSTTANFQNDARHETKALKRTRKSVPRDTPSQRSSNYRGVTRHRWTGRYEAHLWDKDCWNEGQNKKGRQGAYDDEETAARAYDLAALKYWGIETVLNFPILTYQDELKEMEGQSREEYIGYLRRKSSGFSRGVSKYRGVARHHHNGRWEARIGRVFGNKYLYLGTYATQEEAATAYDRAAIEYRGLNAVTNFDLSRYVKCLRPTAPNHPNNLPSNPNCRSDPVPDDLDPSSKQTTVALPEPGRDDSSAALGLILQSSEFKDMLEMTSETEASETPPESDRPRRCFPDDIQTYFDCTQDSGYFTESEDGIFGYLNSFTSYTFHCELDA